MNISYCCPSYKRPKVLTLNLIPWCKVYVDGVEYDEYKKNNSKGQIVRCADGIQGNVARVRNYILEQEFSNGADAVCIMDDDIRHLYLWVGDEEKHVMKKEELGTERIQEFVEKYTMLCKEWGFMMWGANINQDALGYRQYAPFSTTSFIGGPFGVFLRGNECRYDENLPLKEDYDMVIQNCNKYRGVLRVNFLMYDAKQSEQDGGCVAMRNMKREKQQFEALQKKWGKDIIKEDTTVLKKTKKQKRFDYNPKIKIPIKGI